MWLANPCLSETFLSLAEVTQDFACTTGDKFLLHGNLALNNAVSYNFRTNNCQDAESLIGKTLFDIWFYFSRSSQKRKLGKGLAKSDYHRQLRGVET